MRKGTIFIFTCDYPSDYYLDYLARELLPNISKQIIKAHRLIKVNGYNIQIMKYPNERLRGYRPEFVYYIGYPSFQTVLNKFRDVDGYIKLRKQVESDTKILSERKQPIRYINEAEEIDLREFTDDNYSLLRCKFKKLGYKDKLKYIWLNIRNIFRREKRHHAGY